LKYILDTNIFITSARLYYSFDYGDKFWDFLVSKAKKGIVFSIDKVLKEINQGNDKLKEWANTKYSKYFLGTETPEVLNDYK